MKTWTITITAPNEKEAQKLTELLNESFKTATKLDEPLHHVYASTNSKPMSKIECTEVKK